MPAKLSPSEMLWPKMKTIKKSRPLDRLSPYVWAVEPVHGCNLRCGHCSCRLMEPKKYDFMSEETWRQTWQLIAKMTPTCRVDLSGIGGEPTLHPELTRFLRIARELSPRSQIQITTNGTMLRSGDLNVADLLDAGANILYIDMYGPRQKFQTIAEESKAPWYFYYDKPESAPSPWTYYGPHQRLVVLQEHPGNWPASRFRAGLLGTWFNHLDWPASKRFGLVPVKVPLARRCNQPFIMVPVAFDGSFLLCCQDGWRESVNDFGNVSGGVQGFLRSWYGKRMQTIRRRLRNKDRAGTSYCQRCNVTFSRCDYKLWQDEDVERYWNGQKWKLLNPTKRIKRGVK